MTGCAMKSEADRIKTEGRQSIHRWRMSKIPPILNGAEDNVGYADGEDIMVRQANPVNLAAAVHDHISCTKSAELRKVPETKDGRVNLPLTDHMYANYSEKPKGLGMITTVSPIPPDIKAHVCCLEEIVIGQLNLIGKQNEKICVYEKKIEALGKELKEGILGQVPFDAKSETTKSGQEVSHKLNTVKDEQEVSCKLNSVKNEIEVSHKHTVQSGLGILPSVRWDENFGFDLTCSQSGECITNTDQRCSVLSKRVGERDDRMCVVKNEEPDNSNTDSALEVANNLSDATPQPSMSYPTMEKRLLTKCCGRSTSKHPSRSLKRRNMVLPDKSSSSRRQIPYLSSSKPSISPSYIKKESEEKTSKPNTISETKTQPVSVQPVTINFKKPHKKRGRKPRSTAIWKDDYLHTDKPYFLPEYCGGNSPLVSAETTIDVPSWRLSVYQSGFRMEGTENIDDYVFEQRHHKYEKEEKRRKKLDLQQQKREVESIQKLSRKQYRGKESQGKLRKLSGKLKRSISLYPSPKDIEYVEITDSLPVIAFGHLIPVFQPSEFSLPWLTTDPIEITESLGKFRQLGTSSYRQKVT